MHTIAASTAQHYSLRNRPHNRQLPDLISRLTVFNFISRMFFRDAINFYIVRFIYCLILMYSCVWQLILNEYVMLMCVGCRR